MPSAADLRDNCTEVQRDLIHGALKTAQVPDLQCATVADVMLITLIDCAGSAPTLMELDSSTEHSVDGRCASSAIHRTARGGDSCDDAATDGRTLTVTTTHTAQHTQRARYLDARSVSDLIDVVHTNVLVASAGNEAVRAVCRAHHNNNSHTSRPAAAG